MSRRANTDAPHNMSADANQQTTSVSAVSPEDVNYRPTRRTTLPIYPVLETVPHLPTQPSALSAVTSIRDDYGNKFRQHYYDSIKEEADRDVRSDSVLAGIQGGSDHVSNIQPASLDDVDLQTEGPLKKRLMSSMKPDLNPGKKASNERFLPRRMLETICDFVAVHEELLSTKTLSDDNEARRCAAFICGIPERPNFDNNSSSREIFAILVLIDRVKYMVDFWRTGLRDRHLPLKREFVNHGLFLNPQSKTPGTLTFMSDESDISDFYGKQWWVHIPFLARPRAAEGRTKAVEFQYGPGTVMPWIFVSENKIRGGFGDVRAINIHPDHYDFVSLICKLLDLD